MSTTERSLAETFQWQRFSKDVIVPVLLAAITVLVFWPAKNCDFVDYDDSGYYYKNQHVLGGLTGENILWAFTNVETANWHPVTWLSLMLDGEFAGKNPAGPHLTNVLLHGANAVLLFFLLRKLTGRYWPCLIVAALFALHPLRVESVAWVSERKDVLSALFGLLALILYARYVEEKRNGPKYKIPYALALLMFALGLMSKPLVVTLPFVMLLLDYWPLGRVAGSGLKVADPENPGRSISNLRLVTEKWPFFLLALAGCVTTVFAQQKGHAIGAIATFTWGMRIENTFISYARYLQKIFWPFSLATPYPYPASWPVPVLILSVALFVGCSFTAIYLAKRRPFAFVGWFWFVGIFVPMIGLVQVGSAAMADRYSYLPTIGIFIILVWAGAILYEKTRAFRAVVIILVLGVLAGLCLRTRDQLQYWKNDGVLFTHSDAVTKNNYVALVNLGTWYSKQGQTQRALETLYRALQMNPDDPSVLYDIGNAFGKMLDWDQAVLAYRRALQLAPDSPDILDNLGYALAQQQQLGEAVTNFQAALKLKPDFADAHNNLATVYFKQGNYDEAAKHFLEAARLEPENAQIVVNLGETLLRLGKIDLALKCYQQAVELQPDNDKLKQRLQTIQQHLK